MLAKLAIGGELDVVSSGELAAGLDGVKGMLGKEPDPKPNYYSRVGTIVTVGTTTNGNVIPLGSPPVGRLWDILGITTCGLDDFTVVAGFVALYFGNHNAMPKSDLRVPGQIIPTYKNLGTRRLICMATEAMYATVNGVAAATTVNVLVQVAEWRVQDFINSSTR